MSPILLFAFGASQAAAPVEIPLAEFSTSDSAFTCLGGAFPTVGIDYDRQHRLMDFNQGGTEPALFMLEDPVRSVRFERSGDTDSWIIIGEGPARRATGAVAENMPVRIELTVRRSATGGTTADFSVRAGTFSVTAAGCRPIPHRRHGPLEAGR